jgi:8-oxo-dGTP pyrophosphatase MutT (NUDIX family)
MSEITAFHIVRLTGVLIEDEKLLVLEQSIGNRKWYLPGGKPERRETIEQGIIREMWEETGLRVKFDRIISISDTDYINPSALHILIMVKRVGGSIRISDNQHETTPIKNVVFIPINQIEQYGFSHNFSIACKNNFRDVKIYSGLDTYFDLFDT